jgi:condensin complex subunit 3
MPGRVARGGARASARTSARNSSPPTDAPDEGADTSLRRAVCTVFSDSQKSTAGHRKCVISLRKIQEACCYEPVNQKQGRQEEDFEEADFNNEFVRCTLRMMAVKKSEPAGDRVVRFLGTFLNVASQKDNELLSEEDAEETSVPETPTARLTTKMLSTLLPLLQVKDKTIRFRATQMTSHIINSLDSLDDNLFHQLRLNLLKRIHDKEAPVRLQAVYGLGRLAAEVDDDEQNEDSDSDNESGHGVLVKLLDILQNDPAAEVRRNLLLNLPLTKEVLPYLLERARDLDGATRRALYARLLPALGDFRHLSLTHREKLLRWGLRDRDEKVREATARLFRERWIEDCAALPADQAAEDEEGAQPQQNNQAADPSLDALLELLERIDIINSGGENGIAQIAMKQFWQGRPDYVDYVSFPDSFWEDLTPELAFVARTFNDFCRTSGKEDGYTGPRALDVLVEEKLPEVTKFGFLLERELNKLIETIREAATEQDEDADEDSVQREFIVEQMLHMAQTFDYSDEVGRRKMFGLMREALALPELPEESTRMVVEVLRLVCGEDAKGEREFCGIVLEAVAEVHDTIMGDDEEEPDSTEESFHSATSHFDGEDGTPQQKKSKKSKKASGEDGEDDEEADEDKAIREIMVNMKCLHIAQCMLQNVQCDLEENVHLVTMLNNLVVPAVRSQEAPIRERGLVCLGLCCVLGKVCSAISRRIFLVTIN